MVKIKIDKNVPVPEGWYGRGSFKYPWNTMNVGESFQIPLKSSSSVRSLVQRHKPKRFAIRAVDKKFARVWRVE